MLCRKCTTFTFWLKPNCDKLTVVSIGLSDLLSEVCVCVCVCVFAYRSVRETEKIRTEEEEDGKGQEGDRMKERRKKERKTGVVMMRERGECGCERTEERVEKLRKRQKGREKKLSHIALMSSGKKWDTVATHTQTHMLQFSAPRKRGN